MKFTRKHLSCFLLMMLCFAFTISHQNGTEALSLESIQTSARQLNNIQHLMREVMDTIQNAEMLEFIIAAVQKLEEVRRRAYHWKQCHEIKHHGKQTRIPILCTDACFQELFVCNF